MTADRRLILWLLGLALLWALVYALRGILLPFVAGIAIAYVLDPVADRMERWRCGRTAAAALLVVLFFLLGVVFLLLFVPVLQDQLTQLAAKLPDYAAALQGIVERLLGVLQARLPPEEFAKLQESVAGIGAKALAAFGAVASGLWSGGMAIVHFLALVIVTPLVAFYLLRDWNAIVARIDAALPRAQAPALRHIAADIDRTLSAFARGQATVCLILAVFYAAGLFAIGLDFGIVIGIIIGILAFIPFVGSAVGLVLSVGLAAAQFGAWEPVAWTLALFVAGHLLEAQVLTPKIVGESVGLHPVWVIFALLAGGALMDFVGVLLAVPVAATIGVLARYALARWQASQ
jgi:predicted PurR-regulated permease PerM